MKKRSKILIALGASVCSIPLLVLPIYNGYAKQSEQKDLEISFNVQEQVYLGESLKIGEVLPVYPDKVKNTYVTIYSPKGKIIEPKNDMILPETEGEYKIVISVVGKNNAVRTETYYVSAVKSDKPVLIEEPTIPIAYLAGVKYEVPQLCFADYNTADKSIAAYKVYLNGQQLSAQTFTPSAEMDGATVDLTYESTSSVTGKTITQTYSAPVLDGVTLRGNGKPIYEFDKMFVTNGVKSAETTEKGVRFVGNRDYTVTFANFVNASFSMEFLKEEKYFDDVDVIVCDSVNKSEKICINFKQTAAAKSEISINGGKSVINSNSFVSETNTFGLSFNNFSLLLEDKNGAAIQEIHTTVNGEKFNGFSSGRVSIAVEVNGVAADSAITVSRICRQALNNKSNDDRVAPSVYLKNSLKNVFNYGETIVIPNAIGVDVLDVNPSVTVSVMNGNATVKGVDRKDLSDVPCGEGLSFLPSSVGEYTIGYCATDISGQSFTDYYTIYVVDSEKPTLALASYSKTDVKLGDMFTIPELIYSDNLTPKEKLSVLITVTDPNGKYTIVKQGEQFKFEMKGNYYIRYSVFDENYNEATVEEKLICEEK